MGRRLTLSNGRRLVDDVIHVAQRVPSAGISGDFDVGPVAKIRRLTNPKISWNVLYMKAYALVCETTPELKHCYVSFPWPHLYQHPYNIAMMTISRDYEGEERLLFARFNRPDCTSLADLQRQYDIYRKAPIDEIKQFRHQIRFAQLPRFLRRVVWWSLNNIWPEQWAAHMGTFGMSISGYKGVYGCRHLSPSTTTLGVDPIPKDNLARSLLTFDHRVIDGTPATRILSKLHKVLNSTIRQELAELAGVDADTGENLTTNEAIERKRQQRSRRIEANRQRKAG